MSENKLEDWKYLQNNLKEILNFLEATTKDVELHLSSLMPYRTTSYVGLAELAGKIETTYLYVLQELTAIESAIKKEENK